MPRRKVSLAEKVERIKAGRYGADNMRGHTLDSFLELVRYWSETCEQHGTEEKFIKKMLETNLKREEMDVIYRIRRTGFLFWIENNVTPPYLASLDALRLKETTKQTYSIVQRLDEYLTQLRIGLVRPESKTGKVHRYAYVWFPRSTMCDKVCNYADETKTDLSKEIADVATMLFSFPFKESEKFKMPRLDTRVIPKKYDLSGILESC